MITTLLESEDESVYFAALKTFKIYHRRTKEFDFMKENLDTMIEEVEDYVSDPENKNDAEKLRVFDKNLKVFKKLASYNLHKVGRYFEKVILEGEVKAWKNEILADCARVFSVGMYNEGRLQTGIRFFIEKFTVIYCPDF